MNDENFLSKAQGQPVDFLDLVTHIPVGVCKFLLDDRFTAIYINQALCELLGYTQEQLQCELNNEIARTFPEDNRAFLVSQPIKEYQSGSAFFRMEHRLMRRGGDIIWVLVSGSFTTHNGIPAANAVVVDITEQKQIEEQLRINEERFRLALAQTDSTIFDYDIATKVMMHADKSAEKYGLSYETHNVPDCLVESKLIHPDCAEVFLEMYGKIRAGEPSASCVIQARTTQQHYIWQKITMTNIYDHNGVAVRAVGILEDIDRQTRREARLLEKSQRDTLTGLYNKGVTESRIQTLLCGDSPSGALLIVDLDAFKDVNDQHGHLFGDLVLMESAHRLTTLFRSKDIVGRIGGDEFFIYLDGLQNSEAVLRKANEICTAFTAPFFHNGTSVYVTCSVGVALCPTDGTDFEALYQKADAALYEAKRNGKNQICLYADGMTVS